jgi:hypothetical protein
LSADIAKRAVEVLGIPGELTPDGILAALVAGGDELAERLARIIHEGEKHEGPCCV